MRVLVTGGFGYVGGRLAQYLVSQKGDEIFLGARQAQSSPSWLPQTQVVQTRWDSSAELENICTGMDAVVHTAGMNSHECTVNPVAALEFNGVVTSRLLQAAVRQGVKRFVYLSTGHVYGSPLVGVITEETCPINLHPYATSHRAGEDVVRAASQRGEIEGVVIRISNAFGTPSHKEVNCWMLLVNDLCQQAVTTGNMVLHSSGLQRRDFVPMADVCRAIDHLLRLSLQDMSHVVFNVSGMWSPTVWEVACLVQQQCEMVLAFQPPLARVSPQIGDGSPELEYRMDALCQTGFKLSTDRTTEIDQLLEFCRTSFG